MKTSIFLLTVWQSDSLADDVDKTDLISDINNNKIGVENTNQAK